MKMKHTSIFFINILILAICFSVTAKAQNDSSQTVKSDSLKHAQKYGLRVGGDLSKIARTALEKNYSGFELMADFRLTKRWYLAAEFGIEEKTIKNNYISATANGSYIKLGADYNAYTNWYGMHNMIYGGLRLATANFSQTRNNFATYSQNQYWNEQFTNNTAKKFNGLNALWVELIVGVKAEVLPNLYVGINTQLKRKINEKQPDNFENLYIPGFNRTYDDSKFGVGYGYNLSYVIPLFKKQK